jgi:hypothetical protein
MRNFTFRLHNAINRLFVDIVHVFQFRLKFVCIAFVFKIQSTLTYLYQGTVRFLRLPKYCLAIDLGRYGHSVDYSSRIARKLFTLCFHIRVLSGHYVKRSIVSKH